MSKLSDLLYRKPFLAVVPPGVGTGLSFIPDSLIILTNNFLNIIDLVFPFCRLILVIATLITTILAIMMQIQKLKESKLKKIKND